MREDFFLARIDFSSGIARLLLPISVFLCTLQFLSANFSMDPDLMGPAVGYCFVLLPLAIGLYRKPRSPSWRQGAVTIAAIYYIVRLSPIQPIPQWPVPSTVKEGFPLPYAFLAPSIAR